MEVMATIPTKAPQRRFSSRVSGSEVNFDFANRKNA
jgi:hypothetical protein